MVYIYFYMYVPKPDFALFIVKNIHLYKLYYIVDKCFDIVSTKT